MKTIVKIFLSTGLVAILLIACSEFSSKEAPIVFFDFGTPFVLANGQDAHCNSEPLHIRFNRVVGDSRCPSDVVCVWAGEVEIELLVGDDALLLRLPDDQGGRSKAFIGDWTFELLEVTPYPVSTNPIPPGQYRAKLLVGKM